MRASRGSPAPTATKCTREIEREFDEMVLYSKRGRTIATYKPFREVLKASDEVLTAIGKMYAFFCMKALRAFVP